MDIKQLIQKTPTTSKERGFAGFKLKIAYYAQSFNMITEARYAKVETEPLLDIEGELEKRGPRGLPITMKWERKVFEGDQEISERDIRYFQKTPEGEVEVEPLDRTTELEIQEQRSLEETTLDGSKSLGTTIPIEQREGYVAESTYEMWGDTALLRLAEYLEKERLAMIFPFSFGRGFKIYTAVAYPLREDGNLYLIMALNTGRRILKHPLKATPAAEVKAKPILPKPILKKRIVH